MRREKQYRSHLSTAVIGIIPTYAQVGLAAAVILSVMRLIQGLCLGGEYGRAII